jgi:F-type H+-transporting ATPase subunit delta
VIGGTAIARRYARAVFGLGEGNPERTGRLLEEFDRLVEQIVASPDLRRCLLTPLFPRAERRGVVDELCEQLDLSLEIRATAAILVKENRMQLLPTIRDELRSLVDQMAGRLEAQVVSARPLDDAQQESLRRALARRVDADVSLRLEVDPDLIGGVIARIGDLLLDGSVRTQLENLGARLRKGSA